MKAILVEHFGPPEVMHLAEVEIPHPGRKEVLIEVKAIGINPVETYIRSGIYPILPQLPYTPGSDIAGVIKACGPEVESFQVGDRIYSTATVTGGYAEKALCREDKIFPLPEPLSFAQGAALGIPAATAWRGLFLRGAGKGGQRVLVHGASGSVGQAAVQLASDAKMSVFGTAGSEAGCALVENLSPGCLCLNHNKADYQEELLAATSGEGFDLIVEMLANKNLERDLALLAPGGRVVIIGSRGRIEIDPRMTMGKETDIRGLSLFQATEKEYQATHEALAKAIINGSLRPTISKRLSLAQAAEAHTQVLENGNGGKIVLQP